MKFRLVAISCASIFFLSAISFGQQKRVPIIQDNSPAVLAENPPPRTPSGKIDFTGLWQSPSTDEAKILVERYGPNRPQPPEMTEWEKERFDYNQDPRPFPNYDPNDFLSSQGGGRIGARTELNPFWNCYPPGLAYLITGWASWSLQEIIQTDKRVLMIYEYGPSMRQIWMDGRKHPEQPEVSWLGHSIGWWEGDTLVVDTVGLRDKNVWLSGAGHVGSPALHIIERYQRLDNDTLRIDFTYEDSKAFKKPWTRHQFRRLRAKFELSEDTRCYPGSPELDAQESLFGRIDTQP